jgi:uncharacterized protein
MLIDFEVGNYLSFKNPVRFSMVAANPIKEFVEENTFQAGPFHLLKSAAIYGANASGKSNLLRAMGFVRTFVLNSATGTQIGDEIRVTPFKFDVATENVPSHFELCFLIDNLRYRYGFEVSKKSVEKEWLFSAEKQKDKSLFLRWGDQIEITEDFKEGVGLEDKTRNNALFLSVVAQFNGETATKIFKWFRGFRDLHGLRDETYERFTASLLQKGESRRQLLNLIRGADVGIEDLFENELTNEELPKSEQQDTAIKLRRFLQRPPRISSVHGKFEAGVKKGFVNLDFSSEESEGTKKLFHIAGPILDCLDNGYTVCIDELDAKLHPLLTKAIVSLFNSSKANPRNAQLIFATHDTNLLQSANLRRDQIWFVEKDREAATDLYSLAEFKLPDGTKVRNDAGIEKNYIRGRYGAVPFLEELNKLTKE